MKIAFDVDVLAKQSMDINWMVHQVADWGYKYIEQSPHPRINPFYKHPLFSKECEMEYRKALRETGRRDIVIHRGKQRNIDRGTRTNRIESEAARSTQTTPRELVRHIVGHFTVAVVSPLSEHGDCAHAQDSSASEHRAKNLFHVHCKYPPCKNQFLKLACCGRSSNQSLNCYQL